MGRRSTAPADLVAGLFGARGSGKSREVKQFLARERPARLLIVDPMDEYGQHARRVESLGAMLKGSDGERFALRYVPPESTAEEMRARFEGFCALAFTRGRLVMVVEEAQKFTRASAAPTEWANCTLRGRHRGLSIFAVSQRPASVDKDFFSNATKLRTGRLNFDDDIRCMANALRVGRVYMDALIGHDWIERDMLTGALTWACAGIDATRALVGLPSHAGPPRKQKKRPK